MELLCRYYGRYSDVQLNRHGQTDDSDVNVPSELISNETSVWLVLLFKKQHMKYKTVARVKIYIACVSLRARSRGVNHRVVMVALKRTKKKPPDIMDSWSRSHVMMA